jgi:hypothetical protein
MNRKRARKRTGKLCATPCRKRNGSPRSSDTDTKGTGRKREHQRLQGKDSRAEVIHQTPCRSPASTGERRRSWLIKGRNTPKE